MPTDQPEAEPDEFDEARKIEEKRNRLLGAVDSAKLRTVEQRVAWILNHYPDARDSDVELAIRYWKQFHADHINGDSVRLKDLFKIARQTSLTRARATIQNDYRLFQASAAVRAHRGTLEEHEREKARDSQPPPASYTVYMDESGKTDDYLVVGGMWVVDPRELLSLEKAVAEILKKHDYSGELHFKKVSANTQPVYEDVIDLVTSEVATISFTSISLDRRGHRDVNQAIATMYEHLVVRSIEHFDSSGRAPLPRSVSVFKDLEELGRDKLQLADLKEHLRTTSAARLDGKLHVDRMAPLESVASVPVQIADLYVSSISRVLNTGLGGSHPKDLVAAQFLDALGIPEGPANETELDGGVVAHMTL